MRFRGLDLNLLVAFSALMQERSVSRAAARLHLSQPALSAALGRLRDHFHDDLLVAQGKRMFPTAFAEALTPQVEAMLHQLGGILDSAGGFDPARSTRHFHIAASDYLLMVLIRPLMRDLDRAAPGVRVTVELPSERSAARLEEGKVDLVLMPEEFTSPHHPTRLAFEEEHVLVGCRTNPAFAGPIGEDALLGMEHVAVLVGTDTPAAFADRQMEHLAKSRRIAVTVPDFAAVPWMVLGTTRVGLMHTRLARMMAEYLPIAIAPLPFAFPTMREMLQYHRARGGDPGLTWLSDRLLDCARNG